MVLTNEQILIKNTIKNLSDKSREIFGTNNRIEIIIEIFTILYRNTSNFFFETENFIHTVKNQIDELKEELNNKNLLDTELGIELNEIMNKVYNKALAFEEGEGNERNSEESKWTTINC